MSVGFSSQLPSVTDFLASQGAFIDTQILMTVIGAANAESVSAAVTQRANQLAGLASRVDAFAATQVELGGAVEKIAATEIAGVDNKDGDWAQRQARNPPPAIGKTPNLGSWDANHPLTYSDDADAKFLKDRGLPVAVFVPAQSKVVQVPNPAYGQLQGEIASLKQQLAAATDPKVKAALQLQIDAKQIQLAATPQNISKTLTAPQIGSPDAYRQNRETIAAYKQQLQDGTADNAVINGLVANNQDLKDLKGDLADANVGQPTKFKDLSGAVGELQVFVGGLASAAAAVRADLLSLVDKAAEAFAFLSDLGDQLAKSGRGEVDRLQKKIASADPATGVDLSALDPHTRALIEDALARLASVTPTTDAQAALESLPPDQKREALKQISSFQQSLEALQGDAAPPTAAPSFQASSRLVRV